MLFPEEPLQPDEVGQRRAKAQLILQANKAMGIDASAIGDQDLRFGVEWLQAQAKETDFPFLSANLVGADGKTVFPAHMTKMLCGAKVGIFAVTTTLDENGKPLLAGDPKYKLTDPVDAAKKEIAALKADGATAIVALTHLGLTEDLALADEAPGINFIFGAHSMSQLAEPQKKGNTWVLQSGYRGKHIGKLDLDFDGAVSAGLGQISDVSSQERVTARIQTYQERIDELKQRIASEPDPDRKTMLGDQMQFYQEQIDLEKKDLPKEGSGAVLRNTIADLNRDLPDDPKVAAMLEATLDEIAKMPPIDLGGEQVKGPESGPFVGVAACQGCHPQEYSTWSETAHAKAYKTLVHENHQMDFDCVPCHTTGYKKEGGPKDPFTVAGLGNVQCEVCHGAGRAHTLDPKNAKLNVKFDESSCRGCHSIEQTGDRFVLSQYLPKVDHGKSGKTGGSAPMK